MPYSASLIAYAFVKKGIEDGKPVTQMKVQKLVYFAHGIHLANNGEPLISETFQAWKFGPVVPAIYNDYKLYGSSPISDTSTLFILSDIGYGFKEPDLSELDKKAIESIDITWNALKDSNAIQLSNWTHKAGSPWADHFVSGINDIPIPNKDIENYFKKEFIKN